MSGLLPIIERWEGYGHGPFNIHLEESLPCDVCALLAELRQLEDTP
jgi:hypothetical protein